MLRLSEVEEIVSKLNLSSTTFCWHLKKAKAQKKRNN